MALRLSAPFHCNTAASRREQSIPINPPASCFMPRQHNRPRRTTLCFSRRRREGPAGSVNHKKSSKKKLKVEEENGDIDEDAFEALFRQLEEDLKNDDPSFGDEAGDEEISEEELAKLEQELAEALEGDDELFKMFESIAQGEEKDAEGGDDLVENDDGVEDNHDDDDDEEEEEQPLNLKNWQIRRLAYALKNGRRKTSIKNLAAELCLDRTVVLSLLRDPPPKLVMLSAALPEKPVEAILEKPTEADDSLETKSEEKKIEKEVKLPIHAMQGSWSARKRLKKAQVETLEEVYRRTKRPTNAMISSIVHVTNLPRKRVVKWFEDKRAEEGVPEQRSAYHRS